MATTLMYPSDPMPIYPLKEDRENNMIRSSMDAGIVVTRPRYTRMRKKYSLAYQSLKKSKADIIIDFYDSTTKAGGLTFNWTHPITKITKECRFSEPVTVSLTDYDLYTISVKIEEV